MSCQPFIHPSIWRTTPCLLSVYSQLPYISGGCLLHPQPEDTPSMVMGPLITVCNLAVSTKSRTVKLLLDVRQNVLQLRYKNRPFPAATYHSSCKTFNSLYTQMSSFFINIYLILIVLFIRLLQNQAYYCKYKSSNVPFYFAVYTIKTKYYTALWKYISCNNKTVLDE